MLEQHSHVCEIAAGNGMSEYALQARPQMALKHHLVANMTTLRTKHGKWSNRNCRTSHMVALQSCRKSCILRFPHSHIFARMSCIFGFIKKIAENLNIFLCHEDILCTVCSCVKHTRRTPIMLAKRDRERYHIAPLGTKMHIFRLCVCTSINVRLFQVLRNAKASLCGKC